MGRGRGVHTGSATVRDRNTPATTRQEHLDTVPRFAGRALSSPIPVYQGPGRSHVADLPKLLVNPRATLPYGADTLRFHIEASGLPSRVRLPARRFDPSGAAVAHDTVA